MSNVQIALKDLKFGDVFQVVGTTGNLMSTHHHLCGYSPISPDQKFTVVFPNRAHLQVLDQKGDLKTVWGNSQNTLVLKSEEDLNDQEKIISIVRNGVVNKPKENFYYQTNTGMFSGTDPEIFAVDEKGEVIPAFTFLPPKSKALEFKLADSECQSDYAYGKVFWDGFQAEGISAAGVCVGYLTDNVRGILRAILNAARKVNPKATLTSRAVVPISEEWLTKATQEQVTFGCSPSFNVYDNPGMPAPGEGRELPFRFAGGHKHFGCGPLVPEVLTRTVKALDKIYGVGLVSLCEGYEDPVRRMYYGRAGEYRLPKHGLEYRVPSCADLRHPTMYHLSWDLARNALGFGITGFSEVWDAPEEEVIEVINNTDVQGARKILARNEGLLRSVMNKRYYDAGENAFLCWTKGMNGFIPEENMEKAWMLDSKVWITHSNQDKLTFGQYGKTRQYVIK